MQNRVPIDIVVVWHLFAEVVVLHSFADDEIPTFFVMLWVIHINLRHCVVFL